MNRHFSKLCFGLMVALAACNGTDASDDPSDTDGGSDGPNKAPPQPVLTIKPAVPVTGDAITVTWPEVVDPDGDPVTYKLTWKTDATDVQFKASAPTIAGEKTVRGQTWTASVVASDGTHAAKPVKLSVTIGDAPPVVDAIGWTPANPLTYDEITANTKATDPEKDKLTWTWSWKVNGTEVKVGPNLRTLTGDNFAKGDTVVLDVTVDDGQGAQVEVSTGSILIGNAPPTAPVVALGPVAARASDPLVCEIVTPGYDADGDTLTYTTTWKKDGVAATGASTTVRTDDTMPAARTADGQSWVCLVESSDGTASSAYVGWDALTVGDTTPLLLDFALGGNFTCATDSNGIPHCWGAGESGQLTPPAEPMTDIAAGFQHACGVLTDGSLTCWGRSASGRLNAPEGTFSSVVASGSHACALGLDQKVACWGTNQWLESEPPEDDFLAVAVGYEHGCAIGADHALACWGHDDSGRITPPVGTDFARISAGGAHTCALTTAGVLTCWGDNTGGQTTVPAGTYQRVAAGFLHTCAITGAGTLACWGDNSLGQTNAPAGSYTNVWAGETHTCAQRSDAAVLCWGDSSDGVLDLPFTKVDALTLGDGYQCTLDGAGLVSCRGSDLAGETYPPYGAFTQIDAGSTHTCALNASGDATCWGDNSAGQSVPPAATQFAYIGAGLSHTCGLTKAGAVQCWGMSSVLYGTQTPPTGTFVGLSVGSQHNCGWHQDGTVECWGFNGIGGTALGGQARPPAALPAVTSVVTGAQHSCALTQDTSEMFCWGVNVGGRPNGSTLDRPGPFSAIYAGGTATCGTYDDGHTECWGPAAGGLLTVPDVDFMTVEIGVSTICGLDFDGGEWCWGAEGRSPIE